MKEEYWILVSKRKPRLWKPTKHDVYDYIWATKEDCESTLTDTDMRYYEARKVTVTLQDK